MKRSEQVSSYQLVEDAVTEVIKPLVEAEEQEERRLLMWINSFAAGLLNRKDFPHLVSQWREAGLTRLVQSRVSEHLKGHGLSEGVDDLERLREALKDPKLSDSIYEDFRQAAA